LKTVFEQYIDIGSLINVFYYRHLNTFSEKWSVVFTTLLKWSRAQKSLRTLDVDEVVYGA